MELDKFHQPVPSIKNKFWKQKFRMKFKLSNKAIGSSQRYSEMFRGKLPFGVIWLC